MLNELMLVTKVTMCNFFGLNEARYSKDPKKRNRLLLTIGCIMMLVVMICASVSGNVILLVSMGLDRLVPSLVASMISGISLMFTLLRAGPTLFQLKSYEWYAPLPIRNISVVISRFISLYSFNAVFTLTIGLAATVTYGIAARPSFFVYPSMILGTLLLPIVPLAIAVILGTIGYWIASKMKNKSMMTTILSLGIFMVVFSFSFNTGNATEEDLAAALTEGLTKVDSYYPISAWFTQGVNGNVLYFILFVAVSLITTLAILFAVSKLYSRICLAMGTHTAKSNYKLKESKGRSPYFTLYTRELKKYTSSAVYLSNTIIGFILAIVVGLALLVVGTETICNETGIPLWILGGIFPIVIPMICNTMPTTAASISLEGKNLWLLQSLPFKMKDIVNAKISLNMTLALPSCLISATCLTFALDTNPIQTVFLFLLPILITMFGSCFGLLMNLKNPMIQWESEVVPVKQSKAAFLTMFILFITEVIAMAPIFVIPQEAIIAAHLIITLAFTLATALVYKAAVNCEPKKID